MEAAHPLLAHGIHAGEHGLGLGHALVVDMGDQSVGGGPGLGRGLTDDHVEADAEAQLAPAPAGGETGLLDLERHVGDRLAPGQVGVDLLGRDLDSGIRRAAEPQGRVGLLHWREEQLPALEPDMLPFMRHGLARQQRAPDAQELVGDGVADGVVEEQAVALELDRPPPVTTLIKSRPSEMRSSVPPCARRRRGSAGRDARRPGSATVRSGRQPRGHDPAVLAGTAGRQQDAVVAQVIGRLSYLAQIGEVDLPGAWLVPR